jgi:hypothetical protein
MEVLTLYMFNPSLERPEHITPGLLLGYMYTQTDRQKDRQTDRQTDTNTHTHTQVCVCVTHRCIGERERREREGLCVHMYSREPAQTLNKLFKFLGTSPLRGLLHV